MQIGDLVRDIADPRVPYGIVVAQQGVIDRWYVSWLTGYWQGKTTSRWSSHLEVVCE